ncbi:hypothetical protein [Streptomyces sp. NPDC048411]|uniref:hypothetical protein n=1 Tax=Streptomyces sp. NPDC048411 TaxID=3157206 RepID=UPI0034559A74
MSERQMSVPDFWAHIGFVVGLGLAIVALFTGRPTWLLLVGFFLMIPSLIVMAIEKPKRHHYRR